MAAPPRASIDSTLHPRGFSRNASFGYTDQNFFKDSYLKFEPQCGSNATNVGLVAPAIRTLCESRKDPKRSRSELIGDTKPPSLRISFLNLKYLPSSSALSISSMIPR